MCKCSQLPIITMYTLGHLFCAHLSKLLFTGSSESRLSFGHKYTWNVAFAFFLGFYRDTYVYKCRWIRKHVLFCLLSILKNSQIVFKHTGYINIPETLQTKYVFQVTVNPDPPASNLPVQELEMYSTTFSLHLFLFLVKSDTRLLNSTENSYYFFQKVIYL